MMNSDMECRRLALLARFDNAYAHRCWLTARARLRDLAHLMTESNPHTSVEENYECLLAEFDTLGRIEKIPKIH